LSTRTVRAVENRRSDTCWRCGGTHMLGNVIDIHKPYYEQCKSRCTEKDGRDTIKRENGNTNRDRGRDGRAP
jgi:hypothetical protein